jgi:hypothetical protein
MPIRTSPICLNRNDHWDRIAAELGLYDAQTKEEPKRIELWWSDRFRRPIIVEGTTRCDELKSHWESLGLTLTGVYSIGSDVQKVYREVWTSVAQRLHRRKMRVQKTVVGRLLSEFGDKGPEKSGEWKRALSILS